MGIRNAAVTYYFVVATTQSGTWLLAYNELSPQVYRPQTKYDGKRIWK